jgi:hypothetical protein
MRSSVFSFAAKKCSTRIEHGYWGIIEPHFKTWGAGQVLFDLVIAVTILLVWMVRELRAAGKAAWPWVLFTLCTGSFGPLIYLLTQTTFKHFTDNLKEV